MNKEKEMTAEEKEQKSKKMDEVFDITSSMVLNNVVKIVGRDLSNEEKNTLCVSLKAYFLVSSLMIQAV